MAKGRLAVNIEYAALRTVCALVNMVPYSAAMAAARLLGAMAVRVFGFKRRRTLDRIMSVFPDKSRREAMSIADRAWMDRHVRDGLKYKEKLQSYVDEGRGVVIMVPHCGNWYMAAWSMAKYGLPLFAIAARQRNPKLNAWMTRHYGDIEVLDRDDRGTLAQIREKLAAGRAFAILPDLRVRKPDVSAPFFGGTANVSHAGAMFAVHCGCPIVVAMMRREGGRHVFDHLDTLRPDPDAPDRRAEAERLTRRALEILDAGIRRHPGEWYWYNKRWILEPPEPLG